MNPRGKYLLNFNLTTNLKGMDSKISILNGKYPTFATQGNDYT